MAVATKIELLGENSAGDVMEYTVSSSVAVPQGTLMQLSASPRTASASSALNQIFVGIASTEKDASDSSESLGVWTNGVFEIPASGSISDGDTVVLASGTNMVQAGNTTYRPGYIVGVALNDASGGLVTVRVRK